MNILSNIFELMFTMLPPAEQSQFLDKYAKKRLSDLAEYGEDREPTLQVCQNRPGSHNWYATVCWWDGNKQQSFRLAQVDFPKGGEYRIFYKDSGQLEMVRSHGLFAAVGLWELIDLYKKYKWGLVQDIGVYLRLEQLEPGRRFRQYPFPHCLKTTFNRENCIIEEVAPPPTNEDDPESNKQMVAWNPRPEKIPVPRRRIIELPKNREDQKCIKSVE